LFCALSCGLVSLLLTLTPACSCVYICKFQFRPIHPPSRRLSGGTDDDNFIIRNLPLFLSDAARAWLEHLPPAQISN
jgi:hypothetical protein